MMRFGFTGLGFTGLGFAGYRRVNQAAVASA
jgi:hypothetical protein